MIALDAKTERVVLFVRAPYGKLRKLEADLQQDMIDQKPDGQAMEDMLDHMAMIKAAIQVEPTS